MSSTKKCKSCGSSDIEVDPARGDAVCTNCGAVLEVNIIVSEVQFEEGAHGNNAIGQFLSAESKGGGSKFGASFHVGMGVESRELTIKKARQGITNLCNQLQLNQHCIETACSFFKMALSRNLTKGRRNSHVHGACVYLTCRTEGTAHLLIDISDVLQICCYELGRTYLKLSQALCLNIPALDPCLYILRFAAKLEFGLKTQVVANTALRLVQRMKRDSIHSGRRPSGLCGAALLIAARLHDFGRSAGDIVKIVKVHESTLRKRLMEFGDTPSSALTLEEFMTVDLEEEQDPPSFKAARKKDKERLQKLMEEEAESITELQKEIEMQLKMDTGGNAGKCKRWKENKEADKFIEESTLGTINEIIVQENLETTDGEPIKELGPDCVSMGLANSLDDTSNAVMPPAPLDVDLTFDELDDEELDSYIMSEQEVETKSKIWMKQNAGFLEEQKLKAEKLKKQKEEGKPEKKRRRPVVRRKPIGPTTSAGEAIEKIIQEKKISSKINYDVLKSLNASIIPTEPKKEEPIENTTTPSTKRAPRLLSTTDSPPKKTAKISPKIKQEVGLPIFKEEVKLNVIGQGEDEEAKHNTKDTNYYEEEEDNDDGGDIRQNSYYEEPDSKENGMMDLLRQHRNHEQDNDDDYEEAYEDEEY